MKTIKNYFFVISILLCIMAITKPSPKQIVVHVNILEELCAKLFGAEYASIEIQKTVGKVRKAFNIQNPSPARYISNRWLQERFSSFTWFGTWINKDAWSKMSQEEKKFLIYHEIAHEAKKHPLKQIGIFSSFLLSSIFMPKKFPSMAIIIAFFITMPYLVGEFEKEADILAAQKLCDQGNTDIVQSYINTLEKLNEEQKDNPERKTFSTVWFKSISEQITYLKAILHQ